VRHATRRVIRALLVTAMPVGLAYVGLCVFLSLTQESWLFRPTVLAADAVPVFDRVFEERNIAAGAGVVVNTLLFPATGSRGVVFLMGGNSSNVRETVPRFIRPVADAGYDLFVADYPGFGKSTGRIRSEADLDAAALAAYEWLRRQYPESHIVVVGYSLGSAPASWLACRHHPQRLVLVAPFYSLAEIVAADYPFLPQRLLRYPMRNDLELSNCSIPVTLFHGSADELIPPSASERLRALLKPSDSLMLIAGAGHLDLPDHPDYQQAMRALLEAGVQPLAAAPKGVKIK
jgi:pimeloyl-ACP methyl ester carboxylesterase